MYNIRKATPEDFIKVLPMAEKFWNTTAHSKTMAFDFDSVLDYYIMMIEMGFILVAEEEGNLIGMIGCFTQPFLLNKNHMVCTEAMWYVDEDYRGLRVAGDLLKRAEDEAKAAGCTKLVMSALSTSPEGLDGYYKRIGYEVSETAYLKEI